MANRNAFFQVLVSEFIEITGFFVSQFSQISCESS